MTMLRGQNALPGGSASFSRQQISLYPINLSAQSKDWHSPQTKGLALDEQAATFGGAASTMEPLLRVQAHIRPGPSPDKFES
jgi:hypothetical protein